MNSGTSRGTARTEKTLWAFLALSLVWGASFLFMKVGLDGLAPAQIVMGRIWFGALTLAAVMTVTRRHWPRDPKLWGHMVVVAITFGVAPYSLFAWAEQSVPSGLASIYNATTPIMTLLLTPLVLRSERLSRAQSGGVLIGIVGVVVLSAPWQLIGSADLAGSVPGQLACLGATFCYGFSGLYLRRFVFGRGVDSLTLSAMEICLAAPIALLLLPFGGLQPVQVSAPVVLSIAALGVLGTGFAYIWYYRVLGEWGAARASTVTYLAPVVGVVLGAVLLGETVSWYEPVGGLIVIAGIVASQRGWRMLRRATSPAQPLSAPQPRSHASSS
ncbi:DMT family transporter [Gryllotalpicola protaetiae]|uniref:DMT family transporter n=1 Tax=Gryllotalpicola protaetiae TaxID=2419771 RepID=A0A387BPI2_9MICO|nr:DMT family transporter [Gryllotalpicola protaetiae]AYG03029.1 DMT family transporter [Gryllotalpicola protaetiae]